MALFDVKKEDRLPKTLLESFIVPPFSTLDTRQGYWIDRKRMWERYLGDTGETRDGEFGRTYNIQKQGLYKQTSMFDPVLVELMYKWFCIPNGKILDPFGGEQTKGVVAGLMGYRYTGIEIRQEQVDVNNKQSEQFDSVKYICGDSTKLLDYQLPSDYDMCFTSPPYFNLEEYSKSDMSASESYRKFMFDLTQVFYECYELLKDNTFTVVKVGEIRDNKTGEMRGFVPDTINMMKNNGWKYYNEIILINQSGTAAIRSAGNMKSRKIVKCHQNVLVFYKGDTRKIKERYEVLR